MSGTKGGAGSAADWLVVLLVLACPVSKLIAVGVLGGALGAALGSPWLLSGTIGTIAALGAVVLVYRRRHDRTRDVRGPASPAASEPASGPRCGSTHGHGN